MDDPRTWWLNLANLAMGIGVLFFCLSIAGAAVYETVKSHSQSRPPSNQSR